MSSSYRGALEHFLFWVPEDKFQSTVSWYLAALAPLGYTKQFEYPGVVGLGTKERADFWLGAKKDAREKFDFHVAFRANGTPAVSLTY